MNVGVAKPPSLDLSQRENSEHSKIMSTRPGNKCRANFASCSVPDFARAPSGLRLLAAVSMAHSRRRLYRPHKLQTWFKRAIIGPAKPARMRPESRQRPARTPDTDPECHR